MMKRKKCEVCLLGMILALHIAGCGNTQPSSDAGNGNAASEETVQSSGESQESISDENTSGEDGKILIAYFTAGENSDVDVVEIGRAHV